MSVVGLQVRVGGAADLVGIVALERAVAEAPHWGEAEYGGIVGSQEAARVGELGVEVRRCLFVAEREGRLVGFAVGKVIGTGRDCLAELESVVVDAGARRGGVGRALCEAVMDWCRGEGAVAMELEVRAGSAGAIALYGELGLVAVGRRAAYYPGIAERTAYGTVYEEGQAEDAVLMRLELEEDE
jgi:[ribosomal protein S18]-alanine N-acetyltransferase